MSLRERCAWRLDALADTINRTAMPPMQSPDYDPYTKGQRDAYRTAAQMVRAEKGLLWTGAGAAVILVAGLAVGMLLTAVVLTLAR